MIETVNAMAKKIEDELKSMEDKRLRFRIYVPTQSLAVAILEHIPAGADKELALECLLSMLKHCREALEAPNNQPRLAMDGDFPRAPEEKYL